MDYLEPEHNRRAKHGPAFGLRHHTSSLAAALGDSASPDTAAILPPHALSQISAFAAGFPATFSTTYLEVRLAAEASAVDFFIALSQAECGSFLSALPAAASAPPGVGASAWQHALAVCRHWSEGHAPQVSSLFFEFDAPEITRPRDPGLFLRLRQGCSPELVLQTLALLAPSLDLASTRDALARCLMAIAPHGRLLHVGALARTSASDLRFHAIVPRTALGTILQTLFPNHACFFGPHSLRALSTGPDWIDLQLQVSGDFVPVVGVEVSFGGQPARDPRWRSWLERVASYHPYSTTPSKLAALLAWPGIREDGTQCELSHLKWVLSADTDPVLKGYLQLSSAPSPA